MKERIALQTDKKFIIQNGKIIESFHTDKNDRKISLKSLGTGPGCYVDDPYVRPEWVQFEEICSNPGYYSGLVSFLVTADNEVVSVNPETPGSTSNVNRTRGRLQVLTSTGTQLFNQANIWSNLVISDLGIDPDATTRRLFRVTFRADNIPSSALATSGWEAKVYLTHYSECEEDINPYPFNTIAAYGNPSGITACNIINKISVDPSLHSIAGASANLSCVPSLYSNRHEVEIYASNGTTLLWRASDASGANIPLVTATDVKYISTSVVASGQTVKIRYRNVEVNTSTGAVLCRSNWLAIPEIWVW